MKRFYLNKNDKITGKICLFKYLYLVSFIFTYTYAFNKFRLSLFELFSS